MTKPVITTRAGKGSALTYEELDANFTNLDDATITLQAGTGGTEVASDLNGKITLVAGTNITLSGNNTAKTLTIDSAGGDLVDDPSPQLGADLDVNGHKIITSSSSKDIQIYSNSGKATLTVGSNTGTRIGSYVADSSSHSITIQHDATQWNMFDEASHGITFSGNSASNYVNITSGSITLDSGSGGFVQIDGNKYPTDLGTANYYLKTDGAGNLSWAAGSSGLSDIVNDTTPQLGGNLDIQSYKITTSTTNGNIVLDPNGSGTVVSDAQYLKVGPSTATSGSVFILPTSTNTDDINLYINSGGQVSLYKVGAGSGVAVNISSVSGLTLEDIQLQCGRVRIGNGYATGVITTGGAKDLVLQTNVAGTNSGKITITEGANQNITLAPNGTGKVAITGTANISSAIQVNGKQAVNGPAFSAYPNSGTTQTITSGSQQKVLFQTEEFDTNNNYASSTFTPTVEGYYQLNATVRIDGTMGTGECMIVIWKNGAEFKRGWNSSGTVFGANFWSMTVSTLAYANGSTDYFEIYVQQTSGASRTVTVAGGNITYFNGCMIRGA